MIQRCHGVFVVLLACACLFDSTQPVTDVPIIEVVLLDSAAVAGTAVAINDLGEVAAWKTLPSGSTQVFRWTQSEIVELEDLGAGFSDPRDINDHGDVVGSSVAGTVVHAVVWTSSSMIDLGTFGGTGSRGQDINNRREVAGSYGTPAGESRAFFWSDAGGIDLGTLGGAWSAAYALNDAGMVVGESVTGNGQRRAFLWSDGSLRDLGALADGESRAFAINERGDVVGQSTTTSGGRCFHYPEPRDCHAVLWSSGTLIDLGTLGGSLSAAHDINDAGQVAGVAQRPNGDFHAFLWSEGEMLDLGTLGGSSSTAGSISEQGYVVGSSKGEDDNDRAFVWIDGVMHDLGVSNSRAWDVNDQLLVVGDGAGPILWRVVR